MAALAQISISDSVPVVRLYKPRNIIGLIASWCDVGTALTAMGQSVIEMVLSPATYTKARRVKVSLTLPIEYTDSTTGIVTVKDTFRFEAVWVIPPNAVALQRANFEALCANTVKHATIQAAVRDGEGVY